MLVKIVVTAAVFGVAIYTASYGLWAWRKGNKLGATGTFIIAWLVLISPFLVWIQHARR